MPLKIMSVCPNCFSSRVHQKIGSSLIKEGGMLKIADDMGEVIQCPDCNHVGVDSFSGNEKLVSMLKVRRREKENAASCMAAVQAPEIEAPKLADMSDADTEIIIAQVPKLE
ncbi:MAG: hypothetical protein V1847_03420 [Candidatus Diapherotrites archaeon]